MENSTARSSRTIANISVQNVSLFDPNGDVASVFQRWERWLRSFELYADASGCTDGKQKRQLLLHSAGIETQDIFFTFEPQPEDYDSAARALTKYFKPAKNLPYVRHIFRQAKQSDCESVAQYVTRLRQLAKDCDFGNETADFIRDQVIDKCSSDKLRTRLLAEKDLTLEKCLTIAASKELSEQQSQLIAGEKNVFAINKRGKSRGASSANSSSGRASTSLKCDRCGRPGHKASECRCSQNVKCWNCDLKGHFASQCRKPKRSDSQSYPAQRHSVGSQNRGRGGKRNQGRLHFIDEEQQDTSDSDEYVFAVEPIPSEVTVLIEDEPINMIVDSGASVNILNSTAAAKLRDRGIEFEECKRTLHPYGSPPITAKKLIRAEVQLAGKPTVMAEFLVIPGSQPPLLGRQTSKDLGILWIDVNFVETDILSRYPGINDGIGNLKNCEVEIHVDKSVPPVARKHSRVPFHLRKQVEKELEKLEKEDVIEKVTNSSTEWVSRIVTVPKPKKPDEIRLCVDMREANKAIIRTRHVTPTIEELVADLHGATVFSKIDLRSGYHQLTLKPESRSITTFSTHCGLYRYKRLSFGINSAAEVFQHAIQTVIADVPGTRNVSDDIIIFGKDIKEHDRNLHKLLSTLHRAGLTVNGSKCQFRKDKIEFYGFIFSAEGLKPDPAKVAALKDAAEPQNSSELRSFLGMAQYSARFIPNFATITEPLRRLTRQDVSWSWGEEENRALNQVKQALCESATLAYFDTSKTSEILVDASPVGVAGLISQEGKPVCYASRALSPVEQRYSQTEREALAIVWACEHFDIYIRGSQFKVITDHKPLTTIWDKPSPPARIARWAMRLQPYKMEVIYKPGKDNPADYLSRHPIAGTVSSREEKAAEEFVRFVTDTNTPAAITTEDIQRATTSDSTLVKIMEIIKSGRWHEHPVGMSMETFRAFKNVKDSLSCNIEENIVLNGTLLVIPSVLQDKVIKLAHEGHQGINKTKAHLRSKVWFPNMTVKAENAVRECIPCQANTTRKDMEPLAMSELPPGPWQHLSMDFCGPLPSGESLLVIQDEFSRYPVVEIVRKTTTDSIIPVVDKIFAEFGFPKVIKTDNGPQFRSATWKSFLKHCGVKHRKITPLWPRSNSQAEAFNKPLLKSIRSAKIQNTNWKQAMYIFLRMYRCTPHATTGFSPYYLMFRREPKTKIPQLQQPSSHSIDKELRQRDEKAKRKMKIAADQRNHAKHKRISTGDRVLVRQTKQDKLSTPFWPQPLMVTATKGSMITAVKPDGSTITRNASMFQKIPDTTQPAVQEDEDFTEDGYIAAAEAVVAEDITINGNEHYETPPLTPPNSRPNQQPQPQPRRSNRSVRTPTHLQDFILN